MTKEEQLRLCLMLAFQAMISQGKSLKSEKVAQKVMDVAKLMNEFCNLHLMQTFPEQTMPFVDDKRSAQIDAAISRHREELQKNETTELPTDRDTLIQFYDRLQHRKAQREQWLFYAKASVEELADSVLQFLDEEIEETTVGERQ